MNRQPTDTTQKIFEFIKLPFWDTTKKWISRNTGRTSRKRRTPAKNCDVKIAARSSAVNRTVPLHGDVPLGFSTSRKASDVLERWPDELSYDIVKGIDEGCGRLLQTFGYKMVGTEKEYEDKTISYLPELPKTELINNEKLSET